MAALEASVAAAKDARKRHPTRRGADGGGRPTKPRRAGQEAPAAKRATAKKATAEQPAKTAGEAPAKKVAARKSA